MMSENTSEQQKLVKTISKYAVLVALLIFVFIIAVSYHKNNTPQFIEKEYTKIRKQAYHGKITSLLLDKDNGRTRPILIDNRWEKEIPYFLHEKLNVGDSLFKKTESDFEYYVINSKKDTIKRDVNKFYRKKYLDQLDKK